MLVNQKPATRAFFPFTHIASNAREFWFTSNAHAHRLRGLEKTTDAESGYSEEVGIIVM